MRRFGVLCLMMIATAEVAAAQPSMSAREQVLQEMLNEQMNAAAVWRIQAVEQKRRADGLQAKLDELQAGKTTPEHK